MGCKAGQCKTSSPKGIFIVTPSIEGSSTKAKEAPSLDEIRLAPLGNNPVFQFLGDVSMYGDKNLYSIFNEVKGIHSVLQGISSTLKN